MRLPVPIFLLALLHALLLGACASPAHRPYNPLERAQVLRIGLLTPALPDRLAVRMIVHPAESLGVTGILIAESDMGAKSGNFTRAMQAAGLHSREAFTDALLAALNRGGHSVLAIDVPRPRHQYAFLETYPPDDGSVDAYLDVYADLVGYTAAGSGAPYRPTVSLHLRLLRAADHRVLYQDQIAYNAFGDGDGALTLTAAPDYAFDGYDGLMATPARAVEGLQLAMRATGDELARQLR